MRPNRETRRALQRRRGNITVPMVRVRDLTMHEADLTAEAYDAYRRVMDEDVPLEERTELQRWAYDRAGQLRELVQAAVDGRVTIDIHSEREPEETT